MKVLRRFGDSQELREIHLESNDAAVIPSGATLLCAGRHPMAMTLISIRAGQIPEAYDFIPLQEKVSFRPGGNYPKCPTCGADMFFSDSKGRYIFMVKEAE